LLEFVGDPNFGQVSNASFASQDPLLLWSTPNLFELLQVKSQKLQLPIFATESMGVHHEMMAIKPTNVGFNQPT